MPRLPLNLIPAPPGAGSSCVRVAVKKNPCKACVEACPLQAVTIVSGKVAIDETQCNQCGRCLYACPTDALENIHPVTRHWEDDRLVAPLSLQPACLDELLLWHAEKGIRAIELDAQQVAWLRAVAELNMVLKQLNQPTWRLAPATPGTVNTARRQWLPVRDPATRGTVSTGRRALRDAVTFSHRWRILLETEKCYLCGACARICPEQAIRLHADHLTLDSSRCTGCGQCAVVCFPQAIRSEKQWNNDATQRIPVMTSTCTDCGQGFTAWDAQQSICPFCQQHTYGMR